MFEGIISSLISNYLSNYCDNIDPKNIELSVLKGYVNLDEINLKKSSFSFDNTPIKLYYGKIGHLQIQLPQIIQILSKPVTIFIDNLLVILCLFKYTLKVIHHLENMTELDYIKEKLYINIF